MACSMHATAAITATATATATTTTTMQNDHNGNARRSSSPRKEKTILGWLVKSANANASASVSNDNDNDNNNRNEQQTNCNCESRAFRDFRGVQTLRLLWSKRISSASEEAQQQHHSAHSTHSGLGTLRKLNKSVSCLVNAFNNARDWPTTRTNAPETRTKRAASLHNLQEVQQHQHKCKDNFYKYKNAEQAKMAATTTTNATFAAIKASDGERFLQWPKREEVVLAASKSKADKQSQREHKVAEQVEKEEAEGEGESVKEREGELQAPLISLQAAATLTSPRVSLSATSAHGGSSESLQTLNSISSSSRTTSSTTTTTTTGRATRRKYSFKTHAGKSFHQHHTPRRMSSHACSTSSSYSSQLHTHNAVGVAAAADVGEQRAESGVSLVRQLTQQFNEIIQKDARLLEQVKRKHGVWLSRGSHVYKIVEKHSTEGGNSSCCSTVQSNIKKFEKLEKPAVPKKPVQLRHNALSLNKQMRNKRRGLQLGKLQLEKQQWEREQEKEQQQEKAELAVLPELSTDEGVQSDVDDAIKPKPQTLDGTSAAAAAAASATALTQSGADEDMEAVAAAEAERQQRRKQKYATIYEKLRFLPFAKAGKRKGAKEEKEQAQQEREREQSQQEREQTQQERKQVLEDLPLQQLEQQHGEQEAPPSPCVEADAKILDALEVLDRKLKVLSQPAAEQAVDHSMELLVSPNDDFEQRLLPNNSFIYQAANKQISNNQLLLNQAVNVTLVNAIEGEQMIMEQKLLELPVQEQQQQVELAEMEPMYEPITPTMETKTEAQASSLFKITNQMEKERKKEQDEVKQKQQNEENGQAKQQSHELQQEDIYQTVEEATVLKPSWLEGYESIAGSCEAAAVMAGNHSARLSKAEDDYESFATPPPSIKEEPATPPAHTTGTLGRNTRDQLPELPKPQRKLPKSPIILRPAPAKPEEEEQEDENIYDTIKGCYESMSVSMAQQQRKPSCDGSSISSNCYESISNYRKSRAGLGVGAGVAGAPTAVTATTTTGVQLSSSGSTLTICSDHRTNSLYESSLAAGVLYGSASVGCRSSLASSAGSGSGSGGGAGRGSSRGKAADKRSSIAGSSDNSDAWVDISDGEATSAAGGAAAAANGAAGEAQFIVVRERCFKQHRVRSPDWSKRIRDKRLQENKAKSCIEDDSDHYYETLSPLGNKRHSTQLLPGQHHHKRNQDLPRVSTQRRSKQHSASALALGQHQPHHHHHHQHHHHHHHQLSHSDDDSDSFEMDSDEHNEEQEQRLQHHNDSGVDMRHLRLPPEPAAPQNQVYAIVRKFKDFISNKKSPKSSQQKLYENTSQHSQTATGTQFYVECRKTPPSQELYENAAASQLSTSEKNLLASSGQSQQLEGSGSNSASLLRPKQKNVKSLRSRLRKSLVGGAFDTKQLATLAATRSTFYIEDPPASASQQEQELDSGFSGDKGPVLAVETPSTESQKFSTVARKAKKEAKAMRRRATIGVRPHEPPPPPPPLQLSKSQLDTVGPPSTLSPTTPTSWYAECGVFKQSSSTNADGELTTPTPSAHGGGSSWYAESGLYQTSGNSVASSSGSSGVSTGNEAGLGDDLQPHSLFSNEPLYQVYSAAKLESITRDLERQDSSTDGYEEIGLHSNNKAQPVAAVKSRPTALQLVEPKNGPSRTLWSEIPEVIHSCILPTLTPRERGLQEAKFEIMTSEASYLKSLNLLRRHFMNNAAFCDTSVLSSRDRKALFSYIVPVHECSERLLTELECCWQNNIMLLGLSRCIYEIAEQHFQVYITFCEHQGRMDRTLRRLKESKASLAFQQQLDKLEASPSCCGLNLHSFLMLPMQRITRLPLLIDAVFSKESPHNAEEYESWKMTLALVQKIVSQCNEAANRWEQAYELERISRQLEFPSHIRALAIAPVGVPKQGAKPRFLVKRGELTHLLWRGDDAKLTFGKRFTKISLYAFLFSDLLVLCKRKGESTFTVFDYCPRSMLTLTSYDSLPQLPTKDIKDPTSKNLMLMTLLENFERKTVELVLSCPSVSDQQRWLEAMRPPEAETPGEKLYESWDCPQVIAKHSYESDEPDVLQLEVGDVVNVSRKLPDGWYQGERIRDGALGWFPGSYTEELNSSHVRSRNLKQRHRLLAFTATYLESQKAK